MPSEPQIRLALRDCYDPELKLNLIDLGAVDSIQLFPDPDAPGSGIPGVAPRLRLTVALLSRGDELDPILRALAHNRLSAFEALSRIEVSTSSTRWSAGRLTPNGRRLLHLPDPAFPILNSPERKSRI